MNSRACYRRAARRWGSGTGWCDCHADWSTGRLAITAWGDGWSPDFTKTVPGQARHASTRFAFQAGGGCRRGGVDIWVVGIWVGSSRCPRFETGGALIYPVVPSLIESLYLGSAQFYVQFMHYALSLLQGCQLSLFLNQTAHRTWKTLTMLPLYWHC